jgi:hypothetical protein
MSIDMADFACSVYIVSEPLKAPSSVPHCHHNISGISTVTSSSLIENKYNTATRMIDQEDSIVVGIDAAPQEYQSVLIDVQLRLQNSVTLEELSKAMHALWRTHAADNGDKSEEDYMILDAFTGFCFRCKKKGHKAHECPETLMLFTG